MPRHTLQLVALATIVLGAGPAAGQTGKLAKRSRLDLAIGVWNQGGASQKTTQIGLYEVETTAQNGGAFVAVGYSYGIKENLSVGCTIGVLSAESESRIDLLGVHQNTVAVFPVLIGVRYYLRKPGSEDPFRPYLAAGVGPYFGYEAKNEVGFQLLQKSLTLTSFGGHAGGGFDIQFGRHFAVNANFGYHLMVDFPERLGGRDNYSGAAFGIGVGWLFGRGGDSSVTGTR